MTVLCTTLQSRPPSHLEMEASTILYSFEFFSSSSYSSLDLVVCTLNFLEVKNYQIHDKSLTKFCIHNDNRKNNQIIHCTWGQITIHILIDELVSSFSRERWSLLNIERLWTFFLLDIEQCGMRSSSVELAWLGSDRESKLLIIRIISLHWKSWPVLLSRCGMKYGLRWNGLSRYFFYNHYGCKTWPGIYHNRELTGLLNGFSPANQHCPRASCQASGLRPMPDVSWLLPMVMAMFLHN